MRSLYEVTDPGDEAVWAVVETEDEAREVYREYLDEDADDPSLRVRLVPDDEVVEFGNIDEPGSESHTAREWADTYGEGCGFLASTVW